MKKKSNQNFNINLEKELEKLKASINNLIKANQINSYLGNKGYSIYKSCLNEDILKYIKKELTVKPFTQSNLAESIAFPIYQESDKKIYVPRFWGLKTFGPPKVVKLQTGENISLSFKGSLRDYQNEVIDSYLKAINFNPNLGENIGGAALIELGCGKGKTVIGLNILSKINKKTIIFVQKTFLKNQWIERIQEFLPNAKIGSIQGQVIDIEDKDIVIAMVQSISMKSYPDSLFDNFGLSIYDEVHHMSSEVFSNCLKKCNTLYSLGLSATMDRKDGLTCVFKMYLGEICYKSLDENEDNNVLVKAIDYIVKNNNDIDDNDTDNNNDINDNDIDDYNVVERDYRGNIKYSSMISKVSNYHYRNDFIINVIENELKINSKQQIILLSHTKAMLNYLYKSLIDKNIGTTGFYIGGMKEQDLKLSEKKQIILATYAMAAEALDIKTLTTLILATPKSDIVQAVGRIMRQKHSRPLIIDIIDNVEPFLNQFNKRKSFYNEKGYKIIRTDNEKYIEYIKSVKASKDDEKLFWKELVYKPRKKSSKLSISNFKDREEAICLI